MVHFYGEATAFYVPGKAGVLSIGTGPKAMPGKGGFLFQADIETTAGKQTIKSDESWKVRPAEAWKQDTPRVNFSLGFVEVFDARKDQQDWKEVAASEADWADALPYASWSDGVAPVEPFGNMRARDIPFLEEKQISAEKIVEAGDVVDAKGETPADQMMAEELVSLTSILNQNNILVSDGKVATIQPASGRSVSLVLDFGRTVTGYSRLEVDAGAGTIVDIGVSERLSRNKENYYKSDDSRAEMPSRKTGILFNREHGKQVDRYITRSGKQSFETGDIKGFRYLQVTFRNIVQPVNVMRSQ